MKTILVDAIHTLFTPEGEINKPLFEYLNSLPNPKIIVTNATSKKIKKLNFSRTNYLIFTKEKNPDKSNSLYFDMLLKHYDLSPSQILYFDHKQSNLDATKVFGINCLLYKGNVNEVKSYLSSKCISEDVSEDFPIKTKNIKLQYISMNDKDSIFQHLTSAITRFMIIDKPQNLKDVEDYIDESIKLNKQKTKLVLVIKKSDTGEFLGSIGLKNLNTRTPEIGIWIKKLSQNKGYGKEALNLLINWSKQYLDFDYLIYKADTTHIISCDLIHSLGGRIYMPTLHNPISVVTKGGDTLNLIEHRIFPYSQPLKEHLTKSKKGIH